MSNVSPLKHLFPAEVSILITVFKIQRQLWEQWIHGQASGGRDANTNNGTGCDAGVDLPLWELNLTVFWKGSTRGCFASRGQTRSWGVFSSK